MDAKIESLRDALAAACADALGPEGLTFRPMFGGIMAYAEGRPFASLSNVGLALKLAPADQSAFLELPGAKRLQYEPTSPPSKSYVVVPDPLVDDPDALEPWARRSAEFVQTLPHKAKKR